MKYLFQLLVLVSLFLVSCSSDNTTSPADPEAYTKANGIIGGMLYDKFWSTESGYNQTNTNIPKFNASGDFFRCKQCHAWDLMGRNGSYNGRGPKSNRPNIDDNNLRTFAQNSTPQQIFDAIKTGKVTRRDISYELSTYDPATNSTIGDQMPDYSQLLTDAQIWDLVKFLKVE
ncbi:MAG: cytochrome c [Ignavibacteriae bacterium]|nr:cytochrome c [Ignavibacteriota bacterium]